MSTFAITALVYAGGFVGGLFTVGAMGIRWFTDQEDPDAAWLVFIWPLVLPWLLGRTARMRFERRRLAAEERRKWLEAPLP